MAQPVRRTVAPAKPRVPLLMMRVWDAPTRLFHWAVVVLVIVSYATWASGRMGWHHWSGYTLLTLLLFRLAWGFVGSETSRFGAFLRSPVTVLAYLRQFPTREPDREIGHNAAGGWAVLLMLLALLVQAVSGLLLGAGGAGWAGVHAWTFVAILVLTALHVVSVFAFAIVKRHDLVRPMVTGKKRLPGTMRQPRLASPALAAALLVLSAVVVWVLVGVI